MFTMWLRKTLFACAVGVVPVVNPLCPLCFSTLMQDTSTEK